MKEVEMCACDRWLKKIKNAQCVCRGDENLDYKGLEKQIYNNNEREWLQWRWNDYKGLEKQIYYSNNEKKNDYNGDEMLYHGSIVGNRVDRITVLWRDYNNNNNKSYCIGVAWDYPSAWCWNEISTCIRWLLV